MGILRSFLFRPGFDSLAGDPLGGVHAEIEDFVTMTRDLVARAESWCGGRVVSSLEGGYTPERMAARGGRRTWGRCCGEGKGGKGRGVQGTGSRQRFPFP